jgi:hypothetical protein
MGLDAQEGMGSEPAGEEALAQRLRGATCASAAPEPATAVDCRNSRRVTARGIMRVMVRERLGDAPVRLFLVDFAGCVFKHDAKEHGGI